MSMSPLPWTSASTIEPRRSRFQSWRVGLPTMILVTLRSRAKARIASLIFSPLRATVSAPSRSADRSVWTTRSRASWGSRKCAGVSTWAAIHWAPSPSAIRFAARTSLAEDRVRHRLPDADAGDLGDDVVEALDVLDVHRRVNVDAGVEQLAHVLPALGMPGARRVAVGELVDQDQGGMARERAVQVEFAQGRPPIVDDTRGEHLEPLQERLGLRTPVGLHVAVH